MNSSSLCNLATSDFVRLSKITLESMRKDFSFTKLQANYAIKAQ
jgi:hypothetical protein